MNKKKVRNFISIYKINRNITWALGDTNFIFSCLKYLSRVSEANESEKLSAREDKIRIPARPCNILYLSSQNPRINFPYFQLARRPFRFPSQLISQCNFSQLAQILHEERVFCRAVPLGTPENNRTDCIFYRK